MPLHLPHSCPPYRDNALGLECGVGFGYLLRTNTTLTRLDLGANPLFGHVGVQCLAEGLSANSSLRELSLDALNMEPLGALALAAAMHKGRGRLQR